MEKLKMPDFQTDAEEAAWWFNHQNQIALEALAGTGQDVLLLDAKDVERGKARAAARGLSDEAYMTELVHRALNEEAA